MIKTIATLGAIVLTTATVSTPTPAHAITGEEAVKVIRVFGDYMDNLHKIFQPPALTPSQPDNPIPTPGTDEPQPEPDTTEFESN